MCVSRSLLLVLAAFLLCVVPADAGWVRLAALVSQAMQDAASNATTWAEAIRGALLPDVTQFVVMIDGGSLTSFLRNGLIRVIHEYYLSKVLVQCTDAVDDAQRASLLGQAADTTIRFGASLIVHRLSALALAGAEALSSGGNPSVFFLLLMTTDTERIKNYDRKTGRGTPAAGTPRPFAQGFPLSISTEGDVVRAMMLEAMAVLQGLGLGTPAGKAIAATRGNGTFNMGFGIIGGPQEGEVGAATMPNVDSPVLTGGNVFTRKGAAHMRGNEAHSLAAAAGGAGGGGAGGGAGGGRGGGRGDVAMALQVSPLSGSPGDAPATAGGGSGGGGGAGGGLDEPMDFRHQSTVAAEAAPAVVQLPAPPHVHLCTGGGQNVQFMSASADADLFLYCVAGDGGDGGLLYKTHSGQWRHVLTPHILTACGLGESHVAALAEKLGGARLLFDHREGAVEADPLAFARRAIIIAFVPLAFISDTSSGQPYLRRPMALAIHKKAVAGLAPLEQGSKVSLRTFAGILFNEYLKDERVLEEFKPSLQHNFARTRDGPTTDRRDAVARGGRPYGLRTFMTPDPPGLEWVVDPVPSIPGIASTAWAFVRGVAGVAEVVLEAQEGTLDPRTGERRRKLHITDPTLLHLLEHPDGVLGDLLKGFIARPLDDTKWTIIEAAVLRVDFVRVFSLVFRPSSRARAPAGGPADLPGAPAGPAAPAAGALVEASLRSRLAKGLRDAVLTGGEEAVAIQELCDDLGIDLGTALVDSASLGGRAFGALMKTLISTLFGHGGAVRLFALAAEKLLQMRAAGGAGAGGAGAGGAGAGGAGAGGAGAGGGAGRGAGSGSGGGGGGGGLVQQLSAPSPLGRAVLTFFVEEAARMHLDLDYVGASEGLSVLLWENPADVESALEESLRPGGRHSNELVASLVGSGLGDGGVEDLSAALDAAVESARSAAAEGSAAGLAAGGAVGAGAAPAAAPSLARPAGAGGAQPALAATQSKASVVGGQLLALLKGKVLQCMQAGASDELRSAAADDALRSGLGGGAAFALGSALLRDGYARNCAHLSVFTSGVSFADVCRGLDESAPQDITADMVARAMLGTGARSRLASFLGFAGDAGDAGEASGAPGAALWDEGDRSAAKASFVTFLFTRAVESQGGSVRAVFNDLRAVPPPSQPRGIIYVSLLRCLGGLATPLGAVAEVLASREERGRHPSHPRSLWSTYLMLARQDVRMSAEIIRRQFKGDGVGDERFEALVTRDVLERLEATVLRHEGKVWLPALRPVWVECGVHSGLVVPVLEKTTRARTTKRPRRNPSYCWSARFGEAKLRFSVVVNDGGSPFGIGEVRATSSGRAILERAAVKARVVSLDEFRCACVSAGIAAQRFDSVAGALLGRHFVASSARESEALALASLRILGVGEERARTHLLLRAGMERRSSSVPHLPAPPDFRLDVPGGDALALALASSRILGMSEERARDHIRSTFGYR